MKKTISTILAASTIISASAVNVIAKDPSYPDVPATHWAFDIVETITAHKAFNGYDDGTFKPDQQMTHEEFTKTVIALLTNDNVGTAEAGQWAAWAQPYLNKAKELGIITADDNTLMAVGTPISRKEMAQIIVKSMEYQGKTLNADISACEGMFTDWNTISDTYKIYIAKAVSVGIINGYEDNTFRADNNLTRVEAAAVIVRMMGYAPSSGGSTATGTPVTIKEKIANMTQEEKNEFAVDFYNKHPDYEYGKVYGDRLVGANHSGNAVADVKRAQNDLDGAKEALNAEVNRYLDAVQKHYGDEIGDISQMTQEEKNTFAIDFYNKHPDYEYGKVYGDRLVGANHSGNAVADVKRAQNDLDGAKEALNAEVNRYLDAIQKHYGDEVYED